MVSVNPTSPSRSAIVALNQFVLHNNSARIQSKIIK